ncbi:MAG: thioredoxin family protein [Phormidesmis sp.]
MNKKTLNKKTLQRRQLLLYFGLGIVGTGAAATLSNRNSVAKSIAKLTNWPTVARKSPPDPAAIDTSATGTAQMAVGTDPPLAAQRLLPEFQGISQWLNSGPLTVGDLKGSVVLIQFWTFACINCQRTLPYITRWHQQYAAQGLKVIGVHTPEFAFERVPSNIDAALIDNQITYPVPIDNEFKTWRAYDNRYWPHLFLADRDGMIRYDHIGEGAYDETEQAIRQLLG